VQKHFNACRCTNIQYLPGSTVRIDDFPLPDISEFSLIFLKELLFGIVVIGISNKESVIC